jgi:hypothetical protein
MLKTNSAAYAGRIIVCLISNPLPNEAIFRHYEEAADKDAFVGGLIATLCLRHRQWLAACDKRAPKTVEETRT